MPRLRRVRRLSAPGPLPSRPPRGIGEDALHFTRWFAQSKYRLMRRFLDELQAAPEERDAATLRDRYLRALRHGESIHRTRALVTLFLALGVVSTATSTIGGVLSGDDEALAPLERALGRAAAVSASFTLLLLAARIALDRYLERIDVAATFLAIELASAGRPE